MSSSQSVHQKPAVVATADDITKLKKLIKEVQFCMLATTDKEGELHSRPMAVNGELETSESGEQALWFFTYSQSHKVNEMNQHGHRLNLSFAHPSNQTYVSISGRGQLVTDRKELEKRWCTSMKAWFPNGIDEPGCALLKVTLEKCELWDAPSSTVAHAISFVKAQVTGKAADPSDHRKLILSQGESTKTEKKEQTHDEAKMQA